MNMQYCTTDPAVDVEPLYSNVYLPPRTRDVKMKHIFFVDSRDIEKTHPFDYTIVIDTPFKNVHSIELKGISFPKIQNEHYVILDIDECKDRLVSIDGSASHRSFAIMYFDKSDTGGVIPLRGTDFDRKLYVFKPELAKMGKLHIRFKTYSGKVVQPGDVNGVVDHTLLFELTTS